MVKKFRQGDIIYMDFDPQAGHEQRGRRPAVVVSHDLFCQPLRICTQLDCKGCLPDGGVCRIDILPGQGESVEGKCNYLENYAEKHTAAHR